MTFQGVRPPKKLIWEIIVALIDIIVFLKIIFEKR